MASRPGGESQSARLRGRYYVATFEQLEGTSHCVDDVNFSWDFGRTCLGNNFGQFIEGGGALPKASVGKQLRVEEKNLCVG